MIDTEQRRELSQDLRRLVTGRMTNDEFDDCYFDRYEESADRAVARIASFGYTLYSSDTIPAYKLKRKYAVDCEMKRAAARCVLFLRSGREYEWPEMPGTTWRDWLDDFVVGLGLPASVAILICSLPPLIYRPHDGEFLWPLAAFGILLLAWSVRSIIRRRTRGGVHDTLRWQQWCASGDYDVWPFLRREQFDRARNATA